MLSDACLEGLISVPMMMVDVDGIARTMGGSWWVQLRALVSAAEVALLPNSFWRPRNLAPG